MFTPLAPAPASAGVRADRPASVPMLARGLFLLHARYGSRPFETLVSSRGAAGPFRRARVARPGKGLWRWCPARCWPIRCARSVFSVNGVPLTEGQTLRQPDLGGTLAQLRVAGIGDLYAGGLARRIEQSSALAGGPVALSDLRGALPKLASPLIRDFHNDKVAFLPPPADGGLAAEAAFDVLAANPADQATAAARSLAVAARYRMGGVTPRAALETKDLPTPGPTAFPASTSFVTMDRNGNAVACALTMDNLFGTGRILANSRVSWPPPRRPPIRRLCCPLGWHGTTTSRRSAPPLADRARRERRWRSPSR